MAQLESAHDEAPANSGEHDKAAYNCTAAWCFRKSQPNPERGERSIERADERGFHSRQQSGAEGEESRPGGRVDPFATLTSDTFETILI
jgi:hypothetical protein